MNQTSRGSNNDQKEYREKWSRSDWYRKWLEIARKPYQGRRSGIFLYYYDENDNLKSRYEPMT